MNQTDAALFLCQGDENEKIECLVEMVHQLQGALEPSTAVPIDLWPGNELCVSCNFMAGTMIGLIEVAFIYSCLRSLTSKTSNGGYQFLPTNQKMSRKSSISGVLGLLGIILSALGWAYYFTIVSIFWNFVSWLMLNGLLMVLPGLIDTYNKLGSSHVLFHRRMKLAGWFVGLVTFALFQNVFEMPNQVVRHLYPGETIVTPNDSLVLNLKDKFFEEVPHNTFQTMTFEQKMLAVDKFIYRTIEWKSDSVNYHMIGLLTTPHEVISRMSGDCQGQAAVTSSLLLSMGFQAWVVETPFHWWTHAQDPVTGRSYNLNVHGHGGLQGDVLPQPIDLVYTHIPPSCTNCSDIYAHNRHSIRYVAPPHHAFLIACTGAHIFVRSGLSFGDVTLQQVITMILGFSVALTLYSSYFQDNFKLQSLSRRFALSLGVGSFIMVGFCFWITVLYPVSLLHLMLTIPFTMTYFSLYVQRVMKEGRR